MSYAYSSGPPGLAGAYHYGHRGVGLRGDSIPSTGPFGPPPLYNDISLPADAAAEFRWLPLTTPAGLSLWFGEDSSINATAVGGGAIPDGIYTGTGRTYKDGAPLAGDPYGLGAGVAPFTFTVGTVTAAPIVTTDPTSQSVTAGTSVSFTSAASGTPAPTPQWRRGGVDISGATYGTYTFTPALGDNGASFACVWSNGVGSPATSATATLTVTAPADTTDPVMTGSINVTAGTTTATVLLPSATDNVGVVAWDCSIDGGGTWPFTSATSTVLLTGLSEGSPYTVLGRARDASGRMSAPLSKAFTTAASTPTVMASPGYIIKAVVRVGQRSTQVVRNPGFSAKDPGENVLLGFDFSDLCAAVSNPAVSVTLHAGAADQNPDAMKSGLASTSGAWVLQRIVGGVAGADYAFRGEADAPDGSHFVLAGVLPVRVA